MSAVVTKAASVRGPVTAADATSKDGVFRVAGSTNNTSFAVPAEWRGKWIRVMAVGMNTQVGQSLTGAASTLVYNQASAVGTGHVASGSTHVDSAERQWPVHPQATHISFISSAATGFTEFELTESSGNGIIS